MNQVHRPPTPSDASGSPADDAGDAPWAEPLAGQLAALRVWRQCVNALAVVAGLFLVGGVIVWLASGAI